MDGDHHEEERPEYEPDAPTPPEREPPLRSTAPQSDYTTGQVGVGFAVLFAGFVLTFGLALLLA
jgi:hypothetical protein